MLSQLRVLDRRILFTGAIVLALSACGGDGSVGIASIPPPPPTAPTPTSTPALDIRISWLDAVGTQAGTRDLFGRLAVTSGPGPSSYRALAPGEATITVAKLNDMLGFTLNAPSGILPTGVGSIAGSSPEIFWNTAISDPTQISENDQGGKWPQFLGQRLAAYRIHSDGSEEFSMSYDFTRGSSTSSQALATGGQIQSAFTYDIGYSYVAMGEWSWRIVDVNGASSESRDLLFVHGDRTPDSAIPVSGTAIYDAHTLNLRGYGYGLPGLPFTLAADFGQRTISAQINQDFSLIDSIGDSVGYPIPGIHVSGSAPFGNNGAFDIPLAGTANYSATNTLATPPTESVTGTMNGAFFGPNAENVGGTFALNRPDGSQLLQDAFVGQQHH